MARDADPVSAFGGIVALNRDVDAATAKAMSEIFLECIVAPSFSEAALEIRRSASFVRGQCRLGRIKSMRDANGYRIRRSALAAYERRRTS